MMPISMPLHFPPLPIPNGNFMICNAITRTFLSQNWPYLVETTTAGLFPASAAANNELPYFQGRFGMSFLSSR